MVFKILSAVGKRIWCDIQDAHHCRALTQSNNSSWESQHVSVAHKWKGDRSLCSRTEERISSFSPSRKYRATVPFFPDVTLAKAFREAIWSEPDERRLWTAQAWVSRFSAPLVALGDLQATERR